MDQAATAAPSPPASPVGRPGRTMALLILTAIGTINFVDRQILSVLAEPIRKELHLSDTQLGLLTGLSFALFYGVVGVPAAMLADRTNRVRLVAAACTIWSLFTGACGFATNFWHLALARFGVGIGERVGLPGGDEPAAPRPRYRSWRTTTRPTSGRRSSGCSRSMALWGCLSAPASAAGRRPSSAGAARSSGWRSSASWPR